MVDLNIVRLIFTLELESESADPYALFGLRPHFVESFRKTAECGETWNEPCTKGKRCPYHHAFSQTLSADPSALRRYQKPSLPFQFDIPVLHVSPDMCRSVEIGLTIIGSALTYANEYIAAMVDMLHAPGFRRRVDASLLMVESEGYGGIRNVVRIPGKKGEIANLSILSLKGLYETTVLSPDAVTLSITTPLRLMAAGIPSRQFDFSRFIRALFRRISSLVYYYGGEEADFDFRLLAEQSLMIRPTSADFSWVEWPGRLSGLIGTGTFTGDLSEYHPFLIAGEYLHAGKGASFGLGRFIAFNAP